MDKEFLESKEKYKILIPHDEYDINKEDYIESPPQGTRSTSKEIKYSERSSCIEGRVLPRILIASHKKERVKNKQLEKNISNESLPKLAPSDSSIFTNISIVKILNKTRNKKTGPLIESNNERKGFKGTGTRIIQYMNHADSSVLAKMRGYINYRFGCNIRHIKNYSYSSCKVVTSSNTNHYKMKKESLNRRIV